MMDVKERFALADKIAKEARRTWPQGRFVVVETPDAVAIETRPQRGTPDRVLVREDGLFFGGSSHHPLNALAARVAGHDISEADVRAMRNRGETLFHARQP